MTQNVREIESAAISAGRKNVEIKLVYGNMIDRQMLHDMQIDTIVNAAKPTLMGSDSGIDGAIHKEINNLIPGDEKFRDKILAELGPAIGKERIRCPRGHAVMTRGYGLCERVIHVVGIPYDGDENIGEDCSSSRINIMESCYTEIVKILKRNDDIKNIAIPIIGSGEYGFPFKDAVEIAIASTGNGLIDWCKQDLDSFEMAELECIYFFIYSEQADREDKMCDEAKSVLEEYWSYFQKQKRVVFQTSSQAHNRYLKEVKKYDEMRGYFAVAKKVRLALLRIRWFFLLPMLIRDWICKKDWERRRKFVEGYTAYKVFCPLLCYGGYKLICAFGNIPLLSIFHAFAFLWLGYHMVDTLTYLLFLIVMTDIQRPSANLIRSMIMLCVNYMEISLDMAYLAFISYKNLLFRNALAFGILGEKIVEQLETYKDYIFVYANTGIKFFFLSMVFGYFAGHMKPKRFRY